ncbi:MAG: DNA recombination protein RmuC [Sulfurimonadaceae bacterium]|nr:DNA recombination protein RmuC [Sulfurimonadaceae bacterium]
MVDLNMVLAVASFVALLVLLSLYLRQKDLLVLLKEEGEKKDTLLGVLAKEKNALELSNAVLQSKIEIEQKSFEEKIRLLKEAKEELSKEFQHLSSQIFEEKTKQFSQTHKSQFEMLLQPFREQIANFSLQSKEQFLNETKERHLLRDELQRLKQMNEQLSQDALNLTKALKGENKTQGNWGEIVLERVLEQSGLREGVEYELQKSYKNEDGKTYRPDVIVHLPHERDVIIDAKVSLAAYDRYVAADDANEKQQALKEHLLSVSSHIKGLGTKRYEKLEGVKTLDYVLLFMPIEGAFMLALQEDGSFFKRAYENNILVVSPATLLVTLRTIEHIWRTRRQEESAQEIVKEAEAMYEKLVLFVEDMEAIGGALSKTQNSYESAMKRLSFGRGNVIARAQKLKELGIKPTKELPLNFSE